MERITNTPRFTDYTGADLPVAAVDYGRQPTTPVPTREEERTVTRMLEAAGFEMLHNNMLDGGCDGSEYGSKYVRGTQEIWLNWHTIFATGNALDAEHKAQQVADTTFAAQLELHGRLHYDIDCCCTDNDIAKLNVEGK